MLPLAPDVASDLPLDLPLDLPVAPHTESVFFPEPDDEELPPPTRTFVIVEDSLFPA